MKHSERFNTLVDAARTRVKETDVAAVYARQSTGDKLHLIDVREESEWDAGHLPGAIHVGKGIIERDIEAHIDDLDAEIILYCGGGFRSLLAADTLTQMGYRNVISMDGGYHGWNEAGHPVVETNDD